MTVTNPPQRTSCSQCDMVIAVTLNDTIYAWGADGTQAGNLLWNRKGDPSGKAVALTKKGQELYSPPKEIEVLFESSVGSEELKP